MDHSMHHMHKMNSMNQSHTSNTKGMDKMMPMPMMMMQMTFYASKEVTLFFEGWKTTSVGEMFASCVALIMVGFLYEGLKVARQILLLRSASGGDSLEVYANPLTNVHNEYNVYNDRQKQSLKNRMLSMGHFIQTLLHMLQVFVGYLLMLAFMTYNAWICISIVFGAGLGYFVFGWKSPTASSSGEHCN